MGPGPVGPIHLFRPCWAHSFVGPWALFGPFICWALLGKFIWALGPVGPIWVTFVKIMILIPKMCHFCSETDICYLEARFFHHEFGTTTPVAKNFLSDWGHLTIRLITTHLTVWLSDAHLIILLIIIHFIIFLIITHLTV